jgi:hypothetical protein
MVANGGGDLLKLIQSGMDKDEPEQPANTAAIATLAILTMSRTRNIDPFRPCANLSWTAAAVKAVAVEGWSESNVAVPLSRPRKSAREP